MIAAQVAFAVERTRAEEQARRSEERLRFALDAASMGTWDWNLMTNEVQWSDNLARIHGLPPDAFDGTFASYEREIHPDDRERVLASVKRALTEGVPHDVEYRIVAPDGSVRWCEGKGRVEYRDGRTGGDERRLRDGDAAQGSGAGEARSSGGIQPVEGRVPGDAVARAANAAERDPGLGPDAAGRRALVERGRSRRSTSSAATRGCRRS